jgi:hypothetical protein
MLLINLLLHFAGMAFLVSRNFKDLGSFLMGSVASIAEIQVLISVPRGNI